MPLVHGFSPAGDLGGEVCRAYGRVLRSSRSFRSSGSASGAAQQMGPEMSKGSSEGHIAMFSFNEPKTVTLPCQIGVMPFRKRAVNSAEFWTERGQRQVQDLGLVLAKGAEFSQLHAAIFARPVFPRTFRYFWTILRTSQGTVKGWGMPYAVSMFRDAFSP